jgi:hypothetical protein
MYCYQNTSVFDSFFALCCVMLCYVVICCVILCYVVLCCVVLSCLVSSFVVLSCLVSSFVVLCCVVQCRVVFLCRQATCPIMVITISEMLTTVMHIGSEAEAATGHRVVSNKVILSIAVSALFIALFLREYFLQV